MTGTREQPRQQSVLAQRTSWRGNPASFMITSRRYVCHRHERLGDHASTSYYRDWLAVLTVSMALLSACQRTDETEPERPEVADSAGIVVIVNPPPADTDPEWSIAVTPTVTIGSANGTAPYVLSEVSGAVVLPGESGFVVADGGRETPQISWWQGWRTR
jgi:hypothetical protein